MSVIRSGNKAPSWCELEDFEIIRMKAEERRSFPRRCEREIYVVASGMPVMTCGDYQAKSGEGGYLHLPKVRAEKTDIWAWHYDTLIVRMVGHWKEMATAGVHIIETVDNPQKNDRPYDDRKTSNFDRHYHDYQEYWVVFDGKAQMVIGEKLFDTGPGDCVIAAKGWHQDCVFVEGGGKLGLVWLGATPRGNRRIGHLYENKHGKAETEVPLP